MGEVGFGVELEADFDLGHEGFEAVGLDGAIGIEQLVAQGKEGDGAVHGAGIDVDVAYFAGEVFGHGAFAAG